MGIPSSSGISGMHNGVIKNGYNGTITIEQSVKNQTEGGGRSCEGLLQM